MPLVDWQIRDASLGSGKMITPFDPRNRNSCRWEEAVWI